MSTDYSSFYGARNSDKTHTIDEFISCQSDTSICYNNLSFIAQYDGIKFNTYNVLSDYLDDIRDNYCKTVVLSTDEAWKYKYRPKLLAYDVYGNAELGFILLIINDMCNTHEFIKDTLLMPTKDGMNELCKYIYNANKNAISEYNEKNKSL